MNHKVSVIVPTRNRKSVLRAVNSILNQTYDNVEVIVVDDGSSSEFNIEDILSNVIHDRRLKIVGYSESKGSAVARNFGADHATGHYITFLDSDDAYTPTCISIHILTHASGREGLISYGRGIRCTFTADRPDKVLSIEPTQPKEESETCAEYLFGREGRMFTPTLFLKLADFKKIRFNDILLRHVDYGFVIDAERASMKFQFIEEPLFYWISSGADEGHSVKGISSTNSFLFLDSYQLKMTRREVILFITNKLTEVSILSRDLSPLFQSIKRYGLPSICYFNVLVSLFGTFSKMAVRKLSQKLSVFR